MKVYKLTSQNGATKSDTQWGPGVTHAVEGDLKLCETGIHAYSDPLLAILLNPIHANLKNPRLWECEGSEEHLDDQGLKSCHRSLTTIKEIEVPRITLAQRVRFAIYCAQAVDDGRCPEWSAWAEKWLSGEDRSARAAGAAAWDAARAAAGAAAWAAARAVAWAAAGDAAGSAAWAAARAAARAAWDAAGEAKIDLVDLARRAVEDEGEKASE